MMVDSTKILTNIALIPSQPYFILFLLTTGYWFLSDYIFKNIFLCVFLAIIFNFILKSIFHEAPLPNHNGFSFPSGHAHGAATFWIALSIYYHKKYLYWLIPFVLSAIAFGLVFSGHHFLLDVIGGYLYSIGTIGLLYAFNKTKYNHLYLCLMSLIILASHFIFTQALSMHLLATVVGLNIFILGFKLKIWLLPKKPPLKYSINLLMVAFGGIAVIAIMIFTYKALMMTQEHIANLLLILTYALTLIWISFVFPWLSALLIPKSISDKKRIKSVSC